MEYDIQKEAERIGKTLGITDNNYLAYLASELDIAYTKGKLSGVNQAREKLGVKGTENERRK